MAKHHYYRVFRRDPAIAAHMPETAICSPRTLGTYLSRYGFVYVKPNVGGRGEGVTRIWRTGGGSIAYIREKGTPRHCATTVQLYERLGLAKKQRHVVQRGLQLSEYRGRKFDVRLMMIRDPKRVWRYSGMLAKTAGRGSIITNIARGHGNVVPIDQALYESHGVRAERLKQEMITLAYRCNRRFDKIRYEWQMGYDFAIDPHGKVWLIEANPGNPAHTLFAKLKDQTLYRNIKRACRAYKKANRK